MQLLRGAVEATFFSLPGHLTIQVEIEREQRVSALSTRTGFATLNDGRTSEKQNPRNVYPDNAALDTAWI